MYGCESWTMKKAEHWRIDAFELWCWKRLLKIPWTARRYNQSILKEVSLEYSLEGLMLKLKLQYFGHLMRRTNSLKRPWCLERLKAGGEGNDEDEMVGWHHWLNVHEFEQAPGTGDGQGSLACYSPWGHKELDTTKRPTHTHGTIRTTKSGRSEGQRLYFLYILWIALTCNHWLMWISKYVWSLRAPCGIFLCALLII